jgi:PLP dependent protein
MINSEDIKRNIEVISAKISQLNKNVKILGVTKTFPAASIEAAIEAGLREFGESRIQEAEEKIPALNLKYKGLKWHFIGHLQANKVNKVVRLFDVIQSIDSEKLAEKVSETAGHEGKKIEALIEIKVSEEVSKSGIEPDKLPGTFENMLKLPNLKVIGLMAMAPYNEDPEKSRPYFKQARDMFDGINKSGNYNLEVLSMGMSGDYITAIEEGSTMVRIGTGIFGERNY